MTNARPYTVSLLDMARAAHALLAYSPICLLIAALSGGVMWQTSSANLFADSVFLGGIFWFSAIISGTALMVCLLVLLLSGYYTHIQAMHTQIARTLSGNTENAPVITNTDAAIIQQNTPADAVVDLAFLDVDHVDRGSKILFSSPALVRMLGGQPHSISQIFDQSTIPQTNFCDINTKQGVVPVYIVNTPLATKTRLYFMSASPNMHSEAGNLSWFLDKLPGGWVALSHDATITAANNDACRLLGKHHIKGMSLSVLISDLGRSVTEWVHDIAHRPGRRFKPEIGRASLRESQTHVQITLSKISWQNKTELIAMITDKTEDTFLKAQAAQVDKMQSLGKLTGGIAHDFNNRLTAILGHCELLLANSDSTDPNYNDLQQIKQNSNLAANLTAQLLAFSRKQTLRSEAVDFREVLSDLTHFLNRLLLDRGNAVLEFASSSNLHPVRADKQQIERVIINLVTNASDAMENRGNIVITTHNKTLETDMQRDKATLPAGNYVVVTVADTGHGIAPEHLKRVFEPFFTTKDVNKGTGLGLSTVYGVVKQMGGFIFVDSHVGKGTKFTLYFTALTQADGVVASGHDADDTGVGATAVPVARKGQGMVLLVDDEASVRTFTARALHMHGYHVVQASSGAEALALLADKERTGSVDIFVSDVIMPEMGGVEWVQKARVDHPHVPVVFTSGYTEGIFGEGQEQVDGFVFLEKPFGMDELIVAVQKALGT